MASLAYPYNAKCDRKPDLDNLDEWGRSKRGLMLVEDPHPTLRAVCSMGDSVFDRWTFKRAYEKEINRLDDPIDDKSLDTHFYTPKIYGFYTPADRKGTYRLSLTAKRLCAMIDKPDRQKEYRELLRNILLTNENKGELFKDFVQFVTQRRTKREISDKFLPIRARTLIAWAKEAGMIDTDGDRIWATFHNVLKPTQQEFWTTVLENYREMQRSEVFGIRKIFVPIGELRSGVCSKLGLEKSEFDEELRRVLSTEYGKKVSFYGAPPDVFKDKQMGTFRYRGKLYVYLTIRE